MNRRTALKLIATAGSVLTVPPLLRPLLAAPTSPVPTGPFQATWDSLVGNYRAPEWFRDAKFGIWAHWSAQCVPEQGDWYARRMYLQGNPQYEHHLRTYGHPSKFGFMEIDHLWRAENWEPERLIARYRRAGAKYFVALANHHDNFDAYHSRHHAWNSVNVGPKRDLVGTWARIAREAGLRFGVSNHSAHAWHWFQPAYGYDGEGPLAGVRYDAATLTKADGRGKWWEGLDPQELYTGPNQPLPAGLTSMKAVNDWHDQHDRVWTEAPPPHNPEFVRRWFLRCQDLIDQHHPDLVYFDNTELPLGQTGLDIAAYYYNASLQWNGGRLEAVLNAKQMTAAHAAAVVADIERGVAAGIRAEPWQTDTCIGAWHYDRKIFEQHRYKSAGQVIRMLADIVSKNGNLLLSVPLRGDGTLDSDEIEILDQLAQWMEVNGEAIFATRPWHRYGEGPSTEETPEAGHFGGAKDVRSKPYTSEDVRFTTKGGVLYAILLAWPANRAVVIKSLAAGHRVTGVELLGHPASLDWNQGDAGLRVTLPTAAIGEHAFVLKISGAA